MSELRLTATDALARALRQQHALDQRRAGRAVWEAPRIVSLEQWVADTWAETWPQEQLLSGSQGLALWLAAIERDNPGLLSTLACARAALAAERLLLRYRLDAARLPAYSAEERAWRDWHAQVRRRMDQQGWLLAEELPWRLARIIDAGDIALPQQVVLHGFDGPLDPAAAALLQALARRCRCRRAEPPAIAPVRLGLRPTGRAAQYRYVAATIAERLRRTETPPRIVVALPDAAQRPALEAALLDHVAPWRLRIGNPHGAPWRWSQGLPLAAQPLIDSAQALLALQPGLNDFDTLSRLLLSPVLWPGPAGEAAAELETGLRRHGWPRLRLSMLIRVAPAAVAEALSRLAAVLATEPRRALPSRWAQAFEQRLQALGWPGPGQLPSAAFQRVRELRRRLARLGAFDRLLGEIDASRARFWFDELLRAGFEPRADHEQPLLIADPAQAVALPCDLLLVCDASVDAFPGRAAPTPFLAIEAQRAAGVPEASAETHRAAALAQAAALCAQAGEIQVLVPAVDERGAELLPGALFDVDWQPDAPQPRASLSQTLADGGSALVWPADDPVPPVAADEAVRGDAGLFSTWFESPFFAFCVYRLGIHELSAAPRGLSAAAQGQVLHRALQTLWGELGDSAALAACTPAALGAAIDAALRPALAQAFPQAELGRALVALEHARMADLLRQWLAHERRRAEPFAVHLREAKLDTELAGLPLRLRVDRVDRVSGSAGDRYLILDYKTGAQADPKGWETDHFRDPQLPLYATLGQVLGLPRVDGIGFAHLKDGHPALSPACSWTESLLEAGHPPRRDWQPRLREWNDRLRAIAAAFMAGDARFDAAALPSPLHHQALLELTGAAAAAAEA